MDLKEKIKLMQHFENGGDVEWAFKDNDEWVKATPQWNWVDFDYRIYDKFRELKRAYSEGAIIEVNDIFDDWKVLSKPRWELGTSYRIKSGIGIKEWDKHKEVIKAFWNGEEIEWIHEGIMIGYEICPAPVWHVDVEYRVKEANELTIKEIEKLTGLKNIKIVKG